MIYREFAFELEDWLPCNESWAVHMDNSRKTPIWVYRKGKKSWYLKQPFFTLQEDLLTSLRSTTEKLNADTLEEALIEVDASHKLLKMPVEFPDSLRALRLRVAHRLRLIDLTMKTINSRSNPRDLIGLGMDWVRTPQDHPLRDAIRQKDPTDALKAMLLNSIFPK